MTTSSPDVPDVPDLSFVERLQPGVAYAVLAVIALALLLFYLGEPIKARLRPKQPDPPPAAVRPAEETQPALPAVIERSDEVAAQFIDHLRSQIRELRDENAELERRGEAYRRDTEMRMADMRNENERLKDMLWRRGG